MKLFVSLRQNGGGTSKTYAAAILPKGHGSSSATATFDERMIARNKQQIVICLMTFFLI